MWNYNLIALQVCGRHGGGEGDGAKGGAVERWVQARQLLEY